MSSHSICLRKATAALRKNMAMLPAIAALQQLVQVAKELARDVQRRDAPHAVLAFRRPIEFAT
jgi:hypothetical protein